MFNTLTQHRWPFNSAVQGDKRCRYAAERHRAKTLATSSVTSKVNPGRQYQAAATRVLTSGQSSFDSVKPGIPAFTLISLANSPSQAVHLGINTRSYWEPTSIRSYAPRSDPPPHEAAWHKWQRRISRVFACAALTIGHERKSVV